MSELISVKDQLVSHDRIVWIVTVNNYAGRSVNVAQHDTRDIWMTLGSEYWKLPPEQITHWQYAKYPDAPA